MKIIYITNARLPTEWAHGLQIMKTCEALAHSGVHLELWAPRKKLHIKESPFLFYGVQEVFSIRRFFTLDWVRFGRIGFLIQTFSFAISVFFALAGTSQSKELVIYCRDELIIMFLSFFGIQNVIWESHDGVWNSSAKYVAKKTTAVVVVSQGLKDFYEANGVGAEKIFVIPNGIDLAEFAHPESKEVARTRLGLPQDKKIALYIGMLERWKGTDTLLSAAALVPEDVLIAVIGGESDAQVVRLAEEYPKAKLLGYHPQRELADNQSAADVLILPNTGKSEIAVRFSSPLKLLSYMASGKPIVASDLPAIRELVDEKSAYLVPPDDPAALACAVELALGDAGESQRRAEAAFLRVQGLTWEARAKKITRLILKGLSL